jgi:hypothetical protein
MARTNSRTIDITGQRFGRWNVLSRARNTPKGQAQWLCRCDCGTESILAGATLRTGHSRSCGCLKREMNIKRSTKHGHATNGISPTYHSWNGMLSRCTNPSHHSYADYGERGIDVCPRWFQFQNFLADMGEKPHGTSLERKDNSLGYSPENCYWATATQQARNKRNNRILSLNGESHTLAEWAERLAMHPATLSDRLQRGWSDEKAITTPVKPTG